MSRLHPRLSYANVMAIMATFCLCGAGVIDSRAERRRYNERDLATFSIRWGIWTWLTYPNLRYQRLLRRVELAVNTWGRARSPLLLLLKAYKTKRSVTLALRAVRFSSGDTRLSADTLPTGQQVVLFDADEIG